MADTVKIGIVGCGNISDIYFQNCAKYDGLEVIACADLDMDKARAQADKYGVTACSYDNMLADEEINIILNITIPAAHFDVSMKALEAGKHVYSEKPLTLNRKEGEELLQLARSKHLRVGCAPDTVLGGGIQTCRKLVDDGAIGRPIAATAFMMCPGHESWHPSPAFYYQPGGGPMFDMGPYYLTALVTLLGPVATVMGSATKGFNERLITSQPLSGQKITVEVPTHVAAILQFAHGTTATLVTSFDVQHHSMPPIEIYGTEGSLGVPDPNSFGGPVKLAKRGEKQWQEVSLTHGYTENSRGIGLLEMALAIRANHPHRASGSIAWHVLDIMHAVHESSAKGSRIQLAGTCEQPAAMDITP